MYASVSAFVEASHDCVAAFNRFVAKHKLSGSTLADHICYKCGDSESFEHIRALFEHESEFIYQSIISGRRIAIVRFKEGIVTDAGVIRYLELSDQKQDLSQQEGFDHIEAYPVEGTYEQLVTHLEETETVRKVERPHHTTHDVILENGYIFRCTHGPLIEKIKTDEMN